jgi:hypothetical protein
MQSSRDIENTDRQVTGPCGCLGIKLTGAAGVPASPEFKKQLEQSVKALAEKAKQVHTNGLPMYLPVRLLLMRGLR